MAWVYKMPKVNDVENRSNQKKLDFRDLLEWRTINKILHPYRTAFNSSTLGMYLVEDRASNYPRPSNLELGLKEISML